MECYVYRIMDGEVAQGLKDGKYAVHDILIS
jgi:hypothetical protein